MTINWDTQACIKESQHFQLNELNLRLRFVLNVLSWLSLLAYKGKWCLEDKGTMHEMTKNDNRASMYGYVLCIGNLTNALKITF